MVRTPARSSCNTEFSRPSVCCTPLKRGPILRTNRRRRKKIAGTVARATSASCQLSTRSRTVVPTSITAAEASCTTPVPAKDLICSTSLVRRVTSWPVSTRS